MIMSRRADQQQYDKTVTGDYPVKGNMLTGPVEKVMDLKYGRNPGYTGAFYRDEGVEGPCIANVSIVKDTKKSGERKDAGFINIEDGNMALDTAVKIKKVFPEYASAVVVKHETACGAARSNSPYEALYNSWEGDPLSAYGSVIALSEIMDKETAEMAASKRLIEWIIAPGYTNEAMDVLNKTGIRLLQVEPFDKEFKGPNLEIKSVKGGYLITERYDTKIVSPEFIEVKFGNPTKEDFDAAILNWIACGKTKSNCVSVGDNYRMYGSGAGQTSRVDSAMIALYKASGRDFEKLLGEKKWAKDLNLVAASDAFWPFTDGPEMLAKAGVRGCIYPTGSDRDDEVMEAFDRNGMFVMITRPEPGNKNKTERGFY